MAITVIYMISSYQAVYFYLQTLLSLSLSELALVPGQCHGCQWSQLLCTKCQWSTSCQKRTCSILAMRNHCQFLCFFSSSMALRPPVLGFRKIWWNRLLPQRVPWIWSQSRWCYQISTKTIQEKKSSEAVATVFQEEAVNLFMAPFISEFYY